LKGWAEITDDDSEAESLSKLEKAIVYINPEGADEIFPFVGTMMGMKLVGKHAERVKGIEPEAMEKLIIKNMRELIIKGAGRRPVVFIIEDLHWADFSSIGLLEILFRIAEKNRVLFINLLRPGYRETGEEVLETIKERYEKIKTEIYLKPLDEKQGETLIHNLVKGKLPSVTRAAVLKRTGGNPFFIEEVIRSFIDEGVVEFKDGKLKVTNKIGSVVIPETIQDVLMTRIDRLDEITKTLLKEASVIGRYFFHKILVKVAQNSEDIDGSLDYLKSIQLIRERMRFEEVEYRFKDALVHEVTYESILLKKRKELHLKVAEAIESVFPERLHEFYGMLALHYSRGENPEKAEEFLIKAGEESLKAAASSEALTYYQEGLKLYLDKYAKAADPEKIATLEQKIGMAFYNKGSYVEAVKHFDRVLEHLGLKRSKNRVISIFHFILDLLKVLKNVYFPSRKSKHIPDKRETEILEIAYHRGTALASVDTYRMLMDSICVARILCRYDLAKARNGVAAFASSSALFFFSGLSFKIAGKLLDYARSYIEPDDEKMMFIHESYEVILRLLSGDWHQEYEYKQTIINSFLDEGEVFMAPNHMFFNGVMAVEQGSFNNVRIYKDKLQEIGELYENEYSWGLRWILGTRYLLKCRKLPEALADAEAGIALANRRNQLLDAVIYNGLKAYIQILQGDIAGAEKSLQEAKEISAQEKQVVPWFSHNYHLSRFLFDMFNLEKSIDSDNKAGIREFRGKAIQSGKTALKIAAKCAIIQTDTFRLMGLYHWLTGDQKKALSWWDKSIKTGVTLNARPDLGRTYLEIGKRILSEKSTSHDLKGIRAEEFLKKARTLFEEMGLDRDLHDLEKIEIRLPLN
jgi:tetratricopeptide (TPR) repeat protein